MPFIEKEIKIQPAELKVRIDPSVVEDVKEYAAFMDSTMPYVVQEVLRKAIAGDKDFKKHRAGGKKPTKVQAVA